MRPRTPSSSALRKLSTFRGDAAFTTWLHRVAVNACYDSLRKKRRRPLLQLAAEEGDERPEPSLPAPDHADGVVFSVDVAEALRQVPEEFRVVLVLADVQDLPYEEIAAVLEIPVGTVKSRVFRGPCGARARPGRGARGTLASVTDVRGRGMNHPYELLADLMDGTLDEGDLAGVQAHLDSCASCREDVADAKAGARAARSLPVEDPACGSASARRRQPRGGRGTPSWYRWAGVAAAAAVVVAIAIALPNVGNGPASTGAADSGGAQAKSAVTAPNAERVGVDRRGHETTTGRRSRTSRSPRRAEQPSARTPPARKRHARERERRRAVCLASLREPAGGSVDAADPGSIRGRGGLHRGLSGRPGRRPTAGHRGRVGGFLEGLHDPLVRLGPHLISPLRSGPREGKGSDAAFRSCGRMSFA